MDQSSLWESGVKLWISDAGETHYEQDLPSCCHDAARRNGPEVEDGEHFECAVCGATWLSPLPAEPEFDAFSYHIPNEMEGVA